LDRAKADKENTRRFNLAAVGRTAPFKWLNCRYSLSYSWQDIICFTEPGLKGVLYVYCIYRTNEIN
jgi:hypothetical protein